MDILKKMRMKDVMVTKVITIPEEDDLATAHEKFIVHGISYLCVVDASERLTGILSRKYLYRVQAPKRIIEGQNVYDKNILLDGDSYFDKEALEGFHLKTIMKRDPFSLGPDDSVATAIKNMSQKQIGCIPILDQNKKVVGVFTNQDVVNLMAQLLA